MTNPRIPPVQAGIWIDHSRAVLVELLPDGSDRTRTLHSDIERGAKSGGGALAHGRTPRVAGANHLRLAERRRNALRNFYRRVWNVASGADEVVLLGRGLAPTELAHAVPPARARCIRAVESVDHLTDAQLRARVLERFGRAPSRVVVGRGPATAG